MKKFQRTVSTRRRTRPAVVLTLCLLVLTSGCVSSKGFPGGKKSALYFPGQVRDFLPGEELNSDWEKKVIGYYLPVNLYQYVDGEAEFYLAYDFQELAAAAYFSQEVREQLITVEIYRMGSKLDAFGVYSSCRQADAEFVPAGTEGFISDFALLFYQGDYFVKILTSGEAESNRKAMLDFAWLVEERIPEDTQPPEELELVALGCSIPRSVKYFAVGFLGYSFFPAGIEAECLVDGKRMKIFVIMCRDEKEAKVTYRGYQQVVKSPSSYGEREFSGIDPYHGEVMVGWKKRYLAGVIGELREERRRELLEELLERLKD